MPIFMDRHDVSEEVTAEIIAELHQADLKIQDRFGCRGLTYWFDNKRKTAFCLVEAPDVSNILAMHNEAHGQIPYSIIEVDPGIVESFLGRIEDPEKVQNTLLNIIDDPAFRVIMIISTQPSSLTQRDAHQIKSSLPDRTNGIVKLLNDYDGQLVKQTTNRLLVSFKSVTNAVHSAIAMQTLFTGSGDHQKNDQTELKIGLNAGVPVTEKKLIFEDTIKLAGRMCVVKGDVIISSEVKDLYNSENSSALNEERSIFVLTSTDEKFLNLLMDYTELNWNNTDLSVNDFSKFVGCSKSQLYRKMISLTGKSPNTFIMEYRLNKALALLNKNAGNVSEIAFETGFSCPSYFSKCFLKQYGNLPSYYLPGKLG